MKTQSELETLKEYFANHKDSALKDYFTFLKYQSISSEPTHKDQVLSCADWVSSYLKEMGFHVELWPTKGHPIVFAKYDQAGPDQPTLLIYNHYDVQPVDPLELWKSPPFEPNVRKGQVYARGAQDNKGQCFYVMLALKALFDIYGGLPINIKLCIEGEEECGSAGLSGILMEKSKELTADFLAIVDLGIKSPDKPAITLGLRGIVTMDVEVKGSEIDLHSGSHGGVAFNPIHALVNLLDGLRDASGKITIPGFYDDVLPLSSEEKANISLKFDVEDYQRSFGANPTGGEHEFTPNERIWFRPTLEVNGINGGYTGNGFKTVIPSKASAKISCRLVPNQKPQKIAKLVASYLENHAPGGAKVAVHIHPGGGIAVRADVNSEIVKAFAEAYREIFHTTCDHIYSGGSIPIVTELAEASGAEVVLVGLGLPDDYIHAPNEHFGIDRIEKGYLSIARAIQLLGGGRCASLDH